MYIQEARIAKNPSPLNSMKIKKNLQSKMIYEANEKIHTAIESET